MPITTPQSNSAFNKLPPALQDFILSEEVAESIHIIEEEFPIPEGKSDDFALKIFGMLTYAYFPEEFTRDLQSEYAFPEDVALKILIEVYDLILEPAGYVLDPNDTSNSSMQSAPVVHVEPHDLPTARVIPPHEPIPAISTPQYSVPAQPTQPTTPVNPNSNPVPMPRNQRPAPWNSMSSGMPVQQSPVNEPSILEQQVESVHNLDHQPALSEHDEDLMPMIIQNSKNIQQQRQQAPQVAPKPVPMQQPPQQTWQPAPAPVPEPPKFVPAPEKNNTSSTSDKRYNDPYREPIN